MKEKPLKRLKTYEIEYWVLTHNGYDNRYVKVKADNDEKALIVGKQLAPNRAKDFKII